MQIELTANQSAFIDLGIREGRFRSAEEAIQQALAFWEQRERARIELRASLDEAEQAIDAGEGEEFTAETLPALSASVKTRGASHLASL